jgi:hypothetical protein
MRRLERGLVGKWRQAGRRGGWTLPNRLAMWIIWCLLLSAAAMAQPLRGTGSITGTVRDTSGALVVGAQVEVRNAEQGIRRNITTDALGIFAVIALDPATGYTVTVTKAGFAVYEEEDLEVLVGEVTNLEPTLRISSEATRVMVSATTNVVDQTKTEVSQVVRQSQILNLPINGRRVDTYVLLTPAVVPDGSSGLVSFRGIAGGNVFLTDGNDTSNQFFDENAGRTRIFTQISQDAVLEFQVLSSGYSAGYGRATGGIINTVTRSGSNAPYGTAYWFFRNRGLDARDPYASVNPPERRQQAGGSLGGKLVQDKLFYFFNTEVHRRDFPLVASLARPPLFDSTGAFTGSCAATAAQCAAALQFLSRQFQVLDRTADSELLFGRLDWLPSQTNHISASFNYLRWISPNGFQTQAALNDGTGVGANGNSSVRTRYGKLAWMYIPGGAWINEFRFGWFKDRHADNLNPSLIPSTGLAQIVVEGQANLGSTVDMPRIDPSENRFQVADNVTLLSGRHSWMFGFDFLNTEDYTNYLANRNGTYQYADFTSFAQDFSGNTTGARNWETYTQRFGNPIFDETVRDYSLFTEDQLRVNSHVTLHYGLRYEYSTLPQPKQANPDYPDSGHIPSVKTNLAPRVGGAVAFNHARTVVRGGYGIFYARYPTGLIATFFQQNGIGQPSIELDARFLADPLTGPVFPDALKTPPPSSPVDLTIPSKDYRNPYTHQGDLAIEHAISGDWNVSAAWLWSRALHLTTVRDLNIGPAETTVAYQIDDANGKAVGRYITPAYRLAYRVNPKYGRVNSVESGGNSYYDGLVVQLRKHLSHGLEGFLAYTWSHAIDFNQGGGVDNIFFSDGPRTLMNGDYRGEKASSQLDQRHRLVVSSTWEPKWTAKTAGLAHVLGAGWRLSQISTFASTQPATATVLVSGVPFPGAAFNSTLNGFGGSPRVPFDPASGLPIDQTIRTDARLTKIFALSERHQLHVNFEAFNVFNRVSNTAVSTVAFEATNLVLRPVAGLGQGVASQGYPDGTNARRAQVSARLIW